MSEKIFSEVTFNPFDLMRACAEELFEKSNIKFVRLPIEDFYNNLNNFPDNSTNPQLASLDGSFCACVGGVTRSPRMSKYLEQKGVKLADRKCRSGFPVSNLPELIDHASIEKDGHLWPQDFNEPLSNLFIGINVESQGSEGCFLLIMNSLLNKKQNSPSDTKIQLTIYLVDGDETTSSSRYRELRAYDPDLDGSEAPAYKGI